MVLKHCPFCGGQPIFGFPEEKDERRYVELKLECCVLTMRDSLGWGQYKSMTDVEIQQLLEHGLTAMWNERYVPESEEIIEPIIQTKSDDLAFGRFA